MPAECSVCSQEYSSQCIAASLRCGHVYCYQCITELARLSQRPLCPGCRKSFKLDKVIKLYIDFPDVPNATDQNSEGNGGPIRDPALIEEQRAESEALAERMCRLGIETTSEALHSVLDDVRRWSQGVQAIQDIEAQVAITRILLNVDLLKNRLEQGHIPSINRGKRSQQEVLLIRENMGLSAQIQNLKDSLQCVEHDLGVQIDIRQQLQDQLDRGRRASEKLVQDLERNIDSMEDERKRCVAVATEYRKQLQQRTSDSEKMLRKCSRLETMVESLEKEKTDLKRQLTERASEVRIRNEIREEILAENEELKNELRNSEALQSEKTRMMEEKDAKILESARRLAELQRDQEHWRDQYFQLRDASSVKDATRPMCVGLSKSTSYCLSVRRMECVEPFVKDHGRKRMKSTALDILSFSRSPPTSLNDVSGWQLDRSPLSLKQVEEAEDHSSSSTPDRTRGPKRRRIEVSSSEPEDGDNEAALLERPIIHTRAGRAASWRNIRPLEDAIASLMSDDIVPDSEPDDDLCISSPKKSGRSAERVVY